MKIQVNSDKEITVDAELLTTVEAEVKRAFQRFENQLTRVEVHLSDLDSGKQGILDKRCLLEVRPTGKKPVSVDHQGSTVEQAVRGAAGKMKRLLQTSFGKAAHQTSRASLRAGKRAMSAASTGQKLERIEASLSEFVDQANEEAPQFERHVNSATDILRKAHSPVEEKDQNAPPNEPEPVKPHGTKRTQVSAKKTSAARGRVSVDGRSPKKKGTYRARRKSWPKR